MKKIFALSLLAFLVSLIAAQAARAQCLKLTNSGGKLGLSNVGLKKDKCPKGTVLIPVGPQGQTGEAGAAGASAASSITVSSLGSFIGVAFNNYNFVELAKFSTYTKLRADTKLLLKVNALTSLITSQAGEKVCSYQIRVDGKDADGQTSLEFPIFNRPSGTASVATRTAGTATFPLTWEAYFDEPLPAGSHQISIYARSDSGNALTCWFNTYGSSISLIVEEVLVS